MRGADLYALFTGDIPEASAGIDRGVQIGVSWFAAGKFVSSFALLFGIGAGLMVARALAAGQPPGRLLARRYAWLLLFGLAHMILLFPGDILLGYGVTGLVLLAFVKVKPRAALWWSGALLGVVTAVTLLFTWLATRIDPAATPAADDPFTAGLEEFLATLGEKAVAAFTTGSYLDVIMVNAGQALILQSGNLLAVPWLLGVFLLGFAVARAGIVKDLPAHRTLLRWAAILGLTAGIPLNAALGLFDPLALLAGSYTGEGMSGGLPFLVILGQVLGAPVLAVGYLATLALWTLRRGPVGPLAAVGRMALTAYLLQSLLALIVFAGFGLYDRLTSGQAMLVVLGIWTVLLVVCPLWLRRFRFGPAEWLWRSLTYGRRQPWRRSSDAA